MKVSSPPRRWQPSRPMKDSDVSESGRIVLPESCMSTPGLIGNIIEYNLKTALYPPRCLRLPEPSR
jgi:hypothetical protein